jgi:hypothetical protein
VRLVLCGPVLDGGPLDGCQHHHHVAPIELRVRVYGSKFLKVLGQSVKKLSAELGMSHLPPPEHDRDLDPGVLGQETNCQALLGLVVVAVDLRPHLDLYDLDPGLPLPGLLLANVPLVLELSVVHDPAHGRMRQRSDFHEIKVEIPGALQRLLQGDDADLLAVGGDEPNLGGADALVDAGVNRDPASPRGARGDQSRGVGAQGRQAHGYNVTGLRV